MAQHGTWNKQMTPGRDRLASFVSRGLARAAARGFAAVGTLSVMGALTAATACNRENARAAAPPPMAPLVTAAPAVSRAVPTYLDEIGRNGAFESVTVTPQVPGRIVERHFQDARSSRKDNCSSRSIRDRIKRSSIPRKPSSRRPGPRSILLRRS